MSRSGRAHCVRWVAWIYQKTSLVPYRWVIRASSTGLPEAFTCPASLDRPVDWVPEAFTCPASLDRPGRLDFQKPSLVLPHWTGQVDWVPEAFTCPVSLDRPGRLDLEARWLQRLLSLESLTLLGTPSLESLTPPILEYGRRALH